MVEERQARCAIPYPVSSSCWGCAMRRVVRVFLLAVLSLAGCGRDLGDVDYLDKQTAFRQFIVEAILIYRNDHGSWPVDAQATVRSLGSESYFIYSTVDRKSGVTSYHKQLVEADDVTVEPVSVGDKKASYVIEGFGVKDVFDIEHDGTVQHLSRRSFPESRYPVVDPVAQTLFLGGVLLVVVALVLDVCSVMASSRRAARSPRSLLARCALVSWLLSFTALAAFQQETVGFRDVAVIGKSLAIACAAMLLRFGVFGWLRSVVARHNA